MKLNEVMITREGLDIIVRLPCRTEPQAKSLYEHLCNDLEEHGSTSLVIIREDG